VCYLSDLVRTTIPARIGNAVMFEDAKNYDNSQLNKDGFILTFESYLQKILPLRQKKSTLLTGLAKMDNQNIISYFWQRVQFLAFTVVSVLVVAVTPQAAIAQRFDASALSINATTTTANSSTLYFGLRGVDATTTKFSGADLGNGEQFDLTSSSLNITSLYDTLAGASKTTPFTSSTFYYRVYLVGASQVPSYTSVSLTRTSASNTSDPVTYALTSSSQTLPIDLLAFPKLTGGGTYQVDIYYDAVYQLRNLATQVTDPGNGATNPYVATFRVIAPTITPSGSSTTWQGKIDSDWQKAGNWSNGVPNAKSDAIVQEKTAGSNTLYPILNDSSKVYIVRNLTLNGDLSSTKALLTIQKAVLNVFGNIRQDAGGLVGVTTRKPTVQDSTRNSTLVLRGVNQVITGPLSMPDVIVAGSGIKSVTGILSVFNTLSFRPQAASDGVIMQTAAERTVNGVTTVTFSTTGGQLIDLRTSGLISNIAGSNETRSSYVKGVMQATRPLITSVNQPFGNIGIELLPNHTANKNIIIKRIVGDPLIGPTPSSSTSAVPIKRQYQITDDNDGANGESVDVTFHYLPSINELNGIKQENLTMYRTINNGVPYTPVGGVLDTLNHLIVRSALASLNDYTLTLGDKTNPLPVSLVSFTATRTDNSALLNWATASEKHNTGFEVQVSTDGATFRKLAFVASQNPNSTQKLAYSYTDVETGKAGVRYYRLRQIDTDGTSAFSPVRAVSFTGNASTVAVTGYPNPFTSTIAFNIDATTVGDGIAHVQLVDMTGRIVREQDLTVANASLTLTDLDGLRSGLYLAKLTLPNGTTQKVRIQKQ
jgi:hypothetical protein